MYIARGRRGGKSLWWKKQEGTFGNVILSKDGQLGNNN